MAINYGIFTSGSGIPGGLQFTGSIYKVCTNGTAGEIKSFSLGSNSDGSPSVPEVSNSGTEGAAAPIVINLGGSETTEPLCVETPMTAVSCSASFLVFYTKKAGGKGKKATSGFGGSFAGSGASDDV